MNRTTFHKGHATHNDFVIILDPDDLIAVPPERVRALCDRRGGIGGDGLLRVVRARYIPEWSGDPGVWFMDYRNADGSVAEMCGNGLRLFVHFLISRGLTDSALVRVGTRAGLREGELIGDDQVRVSMGPVSLVAAQTPISHLGRTYQAVGCDVGNRHAVVFLDNMDELAGLDLATAPDYDRTVFNTGVNVEFVVAVGPRDLSMRVFERGVGETLSCGTGVVASAAAQAHRLGEDGEFRVRVRGGDLSVQIGVDQCYLTGPVVIVAEGSTVL